MRKRFPKDFLTFVRQVTNKRAKIVIDHILAHGSITTEDLEKKYGYTHPPRAVRDVREFGIPIETFTVKAKNGRSIAAYKFGDPTKLRRNKIAGRLVFSKEFKRHLYANSSGRCSACSGTYELRYLQVDHKVPYEVAGDIEVGFSKDEKKYMLLCGSCNRAKSWSCEHCENWAKGKKVSVCKKCYWGSPTQYSHVAMKPIRRLDIQWDGAETVDFDRAQRLARKEKTVMPVYVKKILRKIIQVDRLLDT
jgi:hypothetical protein